MLITISLLAMIFITILSIISGNSFIGTTSGFEGSYTAIINGSEATLELESSELFYIDPVLGFIIMFVALGVLAGIAGFSFLGSGLSDSSVRIITWITFYGAIWGIFSVLAMNLIIAIELYGSLIYLGLTGCYVIGVVQKLVGSGN